MIRPRPAVLAALAVAVLATVESAAALYAPARVPPAADWDAAADEVRGKMRDGDLIVFAPAWVDQVGREHLGDRIPVEMAGRADADRYRRVWEVSIRGARAPETASATLVERTPHGKVTVALYTKPAVEVLYDFTAHAGDARVTDVGRAGDEKPCFRDASGGFHCSAGVHVEPRTLEVDYRPHRGILAPVVAGRTLAIEFPDVPLGASLVGYTGLHDYFSRKNSAVPVAFAVFVDGQERLRVTHHNEDDWRRFAVDTAPGRHTVRFEISAADNAWRTFGFHAEARRGAAP